MQNHGFWSAAADGGLEVFSLGYGDYATSAIVRPPGCVATTDEGRRYGSILVEDGLVLGSERAWPLPISRLCGRDFLCRCNS